MKRKLNIGIVGLGHIAKFSFTFLENNKGCEHMVLLRQKQ